MLSLKLRGKSAAVLPAAALVLCATAAFADSVKTDYDHKVNFEQYHTYCWGDVQTPDPFYVSRIKDAVNQDLQAKGWQMVPSGCQATVFAKGDVHNQKEMQTMYDGMGGGWGMGWGWGGWGWGGPGFGGMGESMTTSTNRKIGNLVVDIFDTESKKLLWRGIASGGLTSSAKKDTKKLDADLRKMFDHFPPKEKS
jgi:hypothetical protein